MFYSGLLLNNLNFKKYDYKFDLKQFSVIVVLKKITNEHQKKQGTVKNEGTKNKK